MGIVGQPLGAKALAQQLVGFGVGQHVQRQWMGGVEGGQADELVAAGDDHTAGGAAGQQWSHLGRVVGVVQHDEHPLTDQQTAIQAPLRLDRLR
jgi:hypothetical protein